MTRIPPAVKMFLAAHDFKTLKLCIASAWLYGTISRGRAAELAKALGFPFKEVEDLKFAEERNDVNVAGERNAP